MHITLKLETTGSIEALQKALERELKLQFGGTVTIVDTPEPVHQIVDPQMALTAMAAQVEEVNRSNGWFDDDRRFGEDIALLHSEVSEALEEYREKGPTAYVFEYGENRVVRNSDYRGLKPLGVPSELADVLIRLLDTASRYNVNLGLEFEAKLAYNRTRGYKHGGKSL